jgi:uncharacterized membrane protein YdjX (TVP38/TMEM64 family)
VDTPNKSQDDNPSSPISKESVPSAGPAGNQPTDGAGDGQQHADQDGSAGRTITAAATEGKLPDLKQVFARLGPVGPLAVIAASMPVLGGFAILGTMGWTTDWLRANDGLGLAVYIGAFAVLAGLALLPTYAQSVLAGFAFGSLTGSFAALSGIMGASLIGYIIAKTASGDRVVGIIEEQPKWQAVYKALVGSGSVRTLGIVTLLRLPPNSPFAITNLVMAATRIPLVTYLVGTVAGIAPRTIIAVVLGAGMSELDFSKAKNWWLMAGGIVVALIVLGIIGSIANKAIAGVTNQPEESPGSPVAD